MKIKGENMEEIKNFKELKEKIKFGVLPYEVMKDIIFQIYVFESEFENVNTNSNKIILLDSNENYDMQNLDCEVEEAIAGYLKQVYILSDYGEGVIIYKKLVSS